GKDTLIDFLVNKGFEIDGRPNTKLSEEMYYALQASFAQDKLVKKKSDEIALPKGALIDAATNKAELPTEDKSTLETTVTKKASNKKSIEEAAEEVVEPAKEEIVTKVDDAVKEEKEEEKAAKEEVIEPIKEEIVENTTIQEVTAEETIPEVITKEAIITPEPQIETTQEASDVKTEIPAKEEKETSPLKNEEVEHISGTTPKLQGTKVLTKIDLDAINLTTRPKKGSAKSTA